MKDVRSLVYKMRVLMNYLLFIDPIARLKLMGSQSANNTTTMQLPQIQTCVLIELQFSFNKTSRAITCTVNLYYTQCVHDINCTCALDT